MAIFIRRHCFAMNLPMIGPGAANAASISISSTITVICQAAGKPFADEDDFDDTG